MNCYSIFKTFFKIGTLLLGGGYVILPLLKSEIVEKKRWISENDLYEYYAISQAIPGIIAANVSIFTGYKLLGQKGAVAAILGVICPAFVSIILIATLLNQLSSLNIMQNIFWGIGLGVIMLIFMAIREMWSKSVTDLFTCGVFLASFILAVCFRLSPALIVVIAVVSGIIYRRKHPAIMDMGDEVR